MLTEAPSTIHNHPISVEGGSEYISLKGKNRKNIKVIEIKESRQREKEENSQLFAYFKYLRRVVYS